MPDPTRRSFLAAAATMAGAACAAPLSAPLSGVGAAPERTGKRILVLGGTGFLGPHFVRSALARGHTVTLFHRGRTNAHLFPDLEHLRGDREQGDLQALRGRAFDAIVDTSGYVPAHVEATARLFADVADHYQFISSVSVYRAFGSEAVLVDEDSEVAVVDDQQVEAVATIRQSMPFYGPLKARCEQAARAVMGERAFVVRPGLIVGPGDNSDRFTWWPVRFDRGGEVLAPGDPGQLVQFVDARDLADWMVIALEQRLSGTCNAVGFAGPVTLGEVLHGCKCATSSAASLVWIDESFLLENGVRPWMELPLWIPAGVRGQIANARAVAAGLRFRPIAETIRDTLRWARTERGDQPFARTGLAVAKEQQLLQRWRERPAQDPR